MPTVVLQLERMGDLAQTLPAVRALVAAGEAPTVIVREPLAALAGRLLPAGAEVRGAPTRLLGPLVSGMGGPVDPLTRELAPGSLGGREAPAAQPSRPRRLINFTYHAAGAALATAMDPRESWGPYLSPAGERLARGVWAAYPIAAFDGRPRGRFHLVDVRLNLCHEALGRAPDQASWASAAGAGPSPEHPARPAGSDSRRIALFVGAGDPARGAGLDWLEAVGRELLDRGLELDLMGGPAEREVAADLTVRLGGVATNRAGGLSLEELPGALPRYAVVAGFDTGPLHLAAAIGCRVVMVLAGAAHLWETGPWGAGDIAIQGLPVGGARAETIPPSLVAAAIEARREGRDPETSVEEGGGVVRVARGGPGGIVYCRPGSLSAEERDLRVRERISSLAGLSPPPPSRAGVSESPETAPGGPRREALAASISRGLRAATQARMALATGSREAAAAALGELSRETGTLLEACLAHEDHALAGFLIRSLLEQIPPLEPAATVAAVEEILLRARRAFPATTAAAGHGCIMRAG